MAATAAEIDGEPIPLLEAFSPAIFRDDWRQHYLAGRIFASFRAPCRLVPGTNVTIAGRTISFDAPVELPPIGADGYVAEACPFAGLI